MVLSSFSGVESHFQYAATGAGAGRNNDPGIQGYNARKIISEVFAFFVLQCTVFGRKGNTRRMSQPDMESIFTKIIFEIFWS